MTIIHVVEPFASGVITAIVSITRELNNVNHIVVHGSRSWVDSGDKVRKKFPPDVHFIPWPHAGREISLCGDLLALVSLLEILRSLKTPGAVIHLHSSKAGFLGRLACCLLGIRRVIYTPHGASFIRLDVSPLKRALFKAFERLGGSFSGVVVGCGPEEGALYGKIGPALWVANGVNTDGPSNPEKKRPVCFAGIANRQKNPVLFNEIARAFHGTDFVWAGDGMLKDRLCSPNITVTGWLAPEEVRKILDSSLVYLSCSDWEGLPYGVLEAMTSSCVLLLKNAPGSRDLVEPGKNGWLFGDLEEAVFLLGKLLADPEKSAAMGRESLRIAHARFSVKEMGEKYYRIYQALLDEKSGSPRRALFGPGRRA
jgi:glycosyltransferase involved in cell wall biosynthesis